MNSRRVRPPGKAIDDVVVLVSAVPDDPDAGNVSRPILDESHKALPEISIGNGSPI